MPDDQTSPAPDEPDVEQPAGDVEAPEVDPALREAVAADEPEQNADAVARAQAAPPGVLDGTGE